MLTVGELRQWLASVGDDAPVMVIVVDDDRGSAEMLDAYSIADEMRDNGEFAGIAIYART